MAPSTWSCPEEERSSVDQEEKRGYRKWAERCGMVAGPLQLIPRATAKQAAALAEQVAERVPRMLDTIDGQDLTIAALEGELDGAEAEQETAEGAARHLNLREIQESGLLWAINRHCLHPRGLALGIDPDSTGDIRIMVSGKGPFVFSNEEDDSGMERFERWVAGLKNGGGDDAKEA